MTALDSVSTEYSPGFKTPRSPAPLHHVDGFPVLRLLQGLPIPHLSFPGLHGSLCLQADGVWFPCSHSQPYGCLGACLTPDGAGEREEGVNLLPGTGLFVPTRQDVKTNPDHVVFLPRHHTIERGLSSIQRLLPQIRCLTIHPVVARPYGDGRNPVHFSPLC